MINQTLGCLEQLSSKSACGVIWTVIYMSVVSTLGVFNLPWLTYHLKVDWLLVICYYWKNLRAIATTLVQSYGSISYGSITLYCATVLWNEHKTMFFSDFHSHPPLGATTGLSVHIIQVFMVKNLFYTDFQCDKIPFNKSYRVINLPLVCGTIFRKLDVTAKVRRQWPRNIANVVRHLNLYFSYIFGNIQSLNTWETPKTWSTFRSPLLLCLHWSNCKLVLRRLNFELSRGICHHQVSLKHTWCLNLLPLIERLNLRLTQGW